MSVVEMVILGMLAWHPMHGYELINKAKIVGLDRWAGIKIPSIYKALKRLEESGMVDGKQVIEGNSVKVVYSTNKKSLARLRELILRALEAKDDQETVFMVAMIFMTGVVTKDEYIDGLNNLLIRVEEDYQRDKENFCRESMPFNILLTQDMGMQMNRVLRQTIVDMIKESNKEENASVFISEENKKELDNI